MAKSAKFTFYGSINDFLPAQEKMSVSSYSFTGTPTVKDAIEAQGIPHPEVFGIYVNSKPADFLYKLQPEDTVDVFSYEFPEKQTVNFSTGQFGGFVLDVHLGKLAKDLRTLGFDSIYDESFSQDRIISEAVQENRTLLTRSLPLLKNSQINIGYWLRSQDPNEQLLEIVKRFELSEGIRPFTRCRICNGKITKVSKEQVKDQLPEKTKLHFDEFFQCDKCRQVYWKGSHYNKMKMFLQKMEKKML